MTTDIDVHDLKSRMHGCWVGKAIGGTLGQSFEGLWGPLSAKFYDPVPTEMVANDDLDLQVVWATVIDEMESPAVDRHVLAQAWLDHVQFPFNEYGVAIRNLREGIRPPWSGSTDNWFQAGEGAAIRSEIWACLAAGDPNLAAAYAYEDACVDHATEGIYAAQFLAALQAMAFQESDPDVLLDRAVNVIPPESGVAGAIGLARQVGTLHNTWEAGRQAVFDAYANGDFTDVRMNTGFVILGWLYGSTFEERILICNNCGGDTDSSTATLGALLGILDPYGIPQHWREPIGEELVLSDPIVGIIPPPTLDGFTGLVMALRDRLNYRAPFAELGSPPRRRPLAVRTAHTDEYRYHRYLRHSFLPPRDAPPTTMMQTASLDGTWSIYDRSDFSADVLLLEYTVDLPASGSYRVMFNTTEQTRVWVDRVYAFDRDLTWRGEPGQLWPAGQEPPLHQSTVLTLEKGEHTILAAVRKPPHPRAAEWVVGVMDATTDQWVPDAFRRRD